MASRETQKEKWLEAVTELLRKEDGQACTALYKQLFTSNNQVRTFIEAIKTSEQFYLLKGFGTQVFLHYDNYIAARDAAQVQVSTYEHRGHITLGPETSHRQVTVYTWQLAELIKQLQTALKQLQEFED